MSLYDKSSLIQVPSLYKDGTLVSTIPEDRSGDFTVVRGSNLSATRVGEDGYIKKGYENLLLQSNTFDTTWTNLRSTETGGQVDKDGGNNAWLLESTDASTSYLQQDISSSGVQTFSVIAKKGTTDYMYLLVFGSNLAGQFFDLNNGTIGISVYTTIDASIEDLGGGWYRCSVIFQSNVTHITIFPADSGTSSISAVGSNIYIQDAQLNQGLVAYPYLETTTAPVQGGLLENTPRIDWSNGVPAVLLEEERTNLLSHSEYFGSWTLFRDLLIPNSTTSPEGIVNAYRFEETATTGEHTIRSTFPMTAGLNYVASVFVKAGELTSITLLSSIPARWSADTTTFSLSPTGSVISGSGTIEPVGNDWYRCSINGPCILSSSSTGVEIRTINGVGTAGDGLYIYGAQLEEGSTPSSYIPTYGTSQTRGSETISDNFNIPTTATIYNSFYSDVAETVFVLDQVFDVVEGLNKVAIAFSPTAVKISVGGSIVANATGTYDTSSLTNIQLGSDNGSDYSNAPISGFYVFPEFLTDEELNSLTA